MKQIALWLVAVAMVSGVVAASAQTSAPTNEPPANLVVDPPLPDLLAQGIVWIPWRAENVQIGLVFGKDAHNQGMSSTCMCRCPTRGDALRASLPRSR